MFVVLEIQILFWETVNLCQQSFFKQVSWLQSGFFSPSTILYNSQTLSALPEAHAVEGLWGCWSIISFLGTLLADSRMPICVYFFPHVGPDG